MQNNGERVNKATEPARIESEEVTTMTKDTELAAKGVSALQKALEAKKIKVDTQTLNAAVEEAHKAILKDCSSCANGWHW